MLVLTSTIALTMAAYLADPMEEALDSYNDCLIGKVLEHLDQKNSAKIFEAATKDACQSERENFHKLVVKDERSYGSSQAEASTYADEEVQGIIDSHVSNYYEYLRNNSRPER